VDLRGVVPFLPPKDVGAVGSGSEGARSVPPEEVGGVARPGCIRALPDPKLDRSDR
jgi:hypothetical protein